MSAQRRTRSRAAIRSAISRAASQATRPDERGVALPDPAAHVPPRRDGRSGTTWWLPVGPADRPLVAVGTRVAVGEPLVQRPRDLSLVTIPAASSSGLTPGDGVEPGLVSGGGRPGRRRTRTAERATVLFVDAEGRAHVAVGRSTETVVAVAPGTVASVDGRGVRVELDGEAIPAALCWGQAVRGTLVFPVTSPDAELRASAIDVAAAGSILVAGARVDIEALTRARALGVRGIVCGGIIGKELRQLEASDERQAAGIHPVAPFGLLVLDGYGRRPIPGPWWDLLSASAGREVAILADSPMLVLDPGTSRPARSDLVRVTAGEDVGREGRLLDLRGSVRGAGGVYLPSGLVALHGRTAGDPPERRIVPLTDLERLD